MERKSRLAKEYQFNDRQIADFHEALLAFPGNVEITLNEFLEKQGKDTTLERLTKHIPISVNGEEHAKHSKWYRTELSNLTLTVDTISDFYYLIFVNEGSGTSRKSGGVPFADIGINEAGDIIFSDLTELLYKQMEVLL